MLRIFLKSQLGAIKAGLQDKKCAVTCICHCLGWVFSLVSEWGGDGNHLARHPTIFFILKSSHKLTHTCCNTKFFPLVLPQALSLFSLFCQSWPISLQFLYFLPFTFTFSKRVLTIIQACAKTDNVQQGLSREARKKKKKIKFAANDSFCWHQMHVFASLGVRCRWCQCWEAFPSTFIKKEKSKKPI